MKVFVGWSGNLSRKVASILHKYLPLIDREFEVFVSEHDIESGARWPKELASKLEKSNFGILCLSQDNLNKPWILFEAGALTKHVEGRACGLLLGGLRPANITGPLAQFQHRLFDEAEVRMLLSDMNTKLDSGLPADQFNMVFDKWWPDMKAEYDDAMTETGPTQELETQRPDRELLEEVLRLMRGLVKSGKEQYQMTDHAGRKLSLTDRLLKLPIVSMTLLVEMWEFEEAGQYAASDGLANARPHHARILINEGILIRNRHNLYCISDIYRTAYQSIEHELHSKIGRYIPPDAQA